MLQAVNGTTSRGLVFSMCPTISLQTITESVDSVCRDGTDMPYVAIQTEA